MEKALNLESEYQGSNSDSSNLQCDNLSGYHGP